MYKILYIIALLSCLSSVACNTPEEDLAERGLEEHIYKGDSVDMNNRSFIQKAGGDSAIFQKYMTLTPVAGRQAQGSACYGDYFVQGYNYNGQLSFYNLKEKSYLTTVSIPAPAPSSRCHVNTMNFGNQKYSEDDFFPILYVCSGYPTNGISYIYGYRIIRSIEDGFEIFSVSLIQTISLVGFGNWTEGIIDTKSESLWIKFAVSGCCYAKYKMPSLNEGDVTIKMEDSGQVFQIGFLLKNSSNQGHLFVDDRILLVSGVPSWGEELAFISINTISGEREYVIDLKEIGLVNTNNPSDNTFEPEGVIVYNGQVMICYRTAIYTFDVKEAKKYLNIEGADFSTSITTIHI